MKQNLTLEEIVDEEFKLEVVFETTWKTIRYICPFILFAIFLCFFKHEIAISDSMYPTINTNDYLFFRKGNSNINRGDIISFISPYNEEEMYAKRVIGLPEETIEIKGEKIYINSVPLENENYVSTKNYIYGYYDDVKLFKIPENSYYVLGDNRCNSVDSRKFGVIEKNKIKGKLFLRIPFGKVIKL